MSITGILSSSATLYQPSTTSLMQKELQQLGSDLQTGNLAAAQKDFSTIQNSYTGKTGTTASDFRHHHHFGGGGTSSSQNSLLQELNQLGQSLSSNDLSGAQQAYSTLQQQLQQAALGSQGSSNSSVSMDA